jgi:hypothetical protein
MDNIHHEVNPALFEQRPLEGAARQVAPARTTMSELVKSTALHRLAARKQCGESSVSGKIGRTYMIRPHMFAGCEKEGGCGESRLVVAAEEFERLQACSPEPRNPVHFFTESPLTSESIDVDRKRERSRAVEL